MSSLILAHRGLTTKAPENSQEAIAAVIETSLDGLEVDLRETSDGQIVLCHDADLARISRRDEKISHLTSHELKRITLEISSKTTDQFLTGHIAFLEDLCELTAGKCRLVNLELKGRHWSDRLLKDVLIKTIRTYQMEEQVVISSFHPWPLRRLQRLAPELRLGLLIHPTNWRLGQPGWTARWLNNYSIHPPVDKVTPETIAFWKKSGYAVYVWTVNEQKTYQELLQVGVTGVISDLPERLKHNG